MMREIMTKDNKLWNLSLYFALDNLSYTPRNVAFFKQLFPLSFKEYKGEYEFQHFLKYYDDVRITFYHKNVYSSYILCLEIVGVLDEFTFHTSKMPFLEKFLKMLFSFSSWEVETKDLIFVKNNFLHAYLASLQDPFSLAQKSLLKEVLPSVTYTKLISILDEDLDQITPLSMKEFYFNFISSFSYFRLHGFNDEEEKIILSYLPKIKKKANYLPFKEVISFQDQIKKIDTHNSCLALAYKINESIHPYEIEILSSYLNHDKSFIFQELREQKGYLYYYDVTLYLSYSLLLITLPIHKKDLKDCLSLIQEDFAHIENYLDLNTFNEIKNDLLRRYHSLLLSKAEKMLFETKEYLNENPLSIEQIIEIINHFTYEKALHFFKNLTYLGSVYLENK